jgi:iron complex transport system permease protein
MTETLTAKKFVFNIIFCLLILAGAVVFCTFTGQQRISIANVLKGPAPAVCPSEQVLHTDDGQAAETNNIDYQIFIIRLQRIILAALIGSALASAGVILQALLRNPLADPYILGISSGAGLGTIVAVLSGISFNLWAGSPISLFAFAGAIGTVWLVWFIGRFTGKWEVTSLLLAGVVINAFFSAVIMFLTSIAKSDQLRTTIFWLMGNITSKDWSVLVIAAICIIGGEIILLTICNKLNALSLGEEEAQNLGVEINKVKTIAFVISAFITAIAVSLSGLIGFIGLIIPHGVRLILGPDHRQLLPASAIIGAAFLVIADTIARTIFQQEQLPVGIITAIAGGPFFLFLLAKYNKKVYWLQ